MPERLDGLTRDDIREMFDLYARTHAPKDLAALCERDSRFRKPAFHAMLRQEHLALPSRAELDDELKQGILAKYHYFFRLLHHIIYRDVIREIVGKATHGTKTVSGHPDAAAIISAARSISELALALVLHQA
jgi:hypothetical protein